MKARLGAVLLALTVPSVALALDISGVHFADEVTVGDTHLVLNGGGTRHATIFGIEVYVAALYVPTRTTEASEILRRDVPRQIILVMKRDVDAETISNGFREGIAHGTSRTEALASELDAFVAWCPEMRNGNRMTVTYAPGSNLTITATGASGTFRGSAALADAFFRMWIGSNPVEDSLRDGLLGRR